MKYVLFAVSAVSVVIAAASMLLAFLGDGTFVFLLISGIAVGNSGVFYIAGRTEG